MRTNRAERRGPKAPTHSYALCSKWPHESARADARLLTAVDVVSDRPRSGFLQHQQRHRRTLIDKSRDAPLGHTPDFADSLLAAWWCRAYRPKVVFRVRRG